MQTNSVNDVSESPAVKIFGLSDFRKVLIAAIESWIHEEYLTYKQAAMQFGMGDSHVSALLEGGKYWSENWLLDAFIRAGGTCHIRRGRSDKPHPEPTHRSNCKRFSKSKSHRWQNGAPCNCDQFADAALKAE